MDKSGKSRERGFTFRSFVVSVFALLLMGIWIEYEELYNTYGGPLAENFPPNSAVGVIWLLLIISGILHLIKKSLRLATAEIVVIYAALVLAAPMMTQGMWHRLFGLLAGIPHNQDFKSYESLPTMLWPHGENLVQDGRFQDGAKGFVHVGGGTLDWQEIEWQNGKHKAPRIANGTNAADRATIAITINRRDKSGKEQLVPGESYLFSALAKAEGFVPGSTYSVKMQADDGEPLPVLVTAENTAKTFSLPGGLKRIGVNPVNIPKDLREKLTLLIGVSGTGNLTVYDVQFFNTEAIEGVYNGRRMVTEKNLATLGPNERDSTVVKPENMFSLAGMKYLGAGYIPLGQWVKPAMAWSLLIGALFLGFLGLNVIMRKQWADNERFTFPLTIIPKNLFAEENGKLSIFRNRVMWAGFAVGLALALWKGLAFYYPALPWIGRNDIRFVEFFTSPVLRAFFKDVNIGVDTGLGISFCALAVSLLVETDILFALWTTFLLFQLWNLCGQIFNCTRFPGYPWDFQQAMGAFIAYAVIAMFVGRQHLRKVIKTAFSRVQMPEQDQEVMSYRLAILAVLVSLAAIAGWGIWTGMGLTASLLFFGYMLICGFAASKVRAEMGAPFSYMTPYFGMQFVAAVGGFAVFKSTGMLVATIASGFMCTASFLLMAPTQVEMMELGRNFKVKPRDVGAGLTLGLLGGLFIGGFVVLCWAYGFGSNNLKTAWPYEQNWYYYQYRAGELGMDRAVASGTIGQNPETGALNFIKNPDAKGLGIGAVITVVLAVLRAHFTCFPFHPIGYVLASSWFMRSCWAYFFVAWLCRLLLFRIGGAQTIRKGLVPFCVGMFMACIASIVIFDVVGILLRIQGVTEVYSKIP